MAYDVELAGMTLKNAIVTAAGPWAGNAEGIQRCINAGAAAVITETICLEERQRISPRLFMKDQQLFNTMLYSNLHLEEWERVLDQIDRKDAKIICSIWGTSASEMAYLGKKLENMGADALEISLSAPIGSRNKLISYHSPDTEDFIHALVDTVNIPVMAKLSYESASSPDFLKELENAGVSAFSAIDALKGLSGVDIERKRLLMPTYGGYTGANIRPVSLAMTAMLRQYSQLPIISSGGVLHFEHVLEFLMLGATAVQLASAIQLHGYDIISSIITSMETWMASHGYTGIEDIRGVALASLRPFEDIVPSPLAITITEPCRRLDCTLCKQSCLKEAVKRDSHNAIVTDTLRCDGCGLCVERCPDKILKLYWR
ncbi:MAG: 4Fe-4S binding protein [Saccharofermentanales bacterium]|jgi:dihydroorotate dehydrogenase subfamily 1